MEEIIDGNVYKKVDLNQFFDYKKNWTAIEKETFYTYKQDDPKYTYVFTDNTMTETYTRGGSYGVRREIKTIYNAKGFVLSQEEKVFAGDHYNETRTILNQFDPYNRVIKIIYKTERVKKEENKESEINVTYENDLVKIKSENGTIICKFIVDPNSVGYISRLSPRETISQFMYALAGTTPEEAREHLSDQKKKDTQPLPKLTSVWSLGGTDSYSQDKVMAEDNWEIESPGKKKERYKVLFMLIKQKNGWKIDDFKINP